MKSLHENNTVNTNVRPTNPHIPEGLETVSLPRFNSSVNQIYQSLAPLAL